MKKLIFGLLSIATMSLTLFSCSKQDEAVGVSQETTIAPPAEVINDDALKQVITAAQLNGKYKLKYTSSKSNRTWVAATSVGTAMFPNTFLYSVGKFNFNPSRSSVAMSAISNIAGLPDPQFGSRSYKVNGESLTIGSGSPSDALLKVYSLSGSWLVLIDKRTEVAWAFNKE
jgi:hypothetical protein